MLLCPHCSDDAPAAIAAAPLSFTSCSACGRVVKDKPFTSLDKLLSLLHQITTSTLGNESSIIITTAQDLLLKVIDKDSDLFAGGGHRRRLVAAACLYAALRDHRKPYMLVDVLDSSKVKNFYALAAVFVALSKILRLNEACCALIDPSLFMHRISSRLLGQKDAEVAIMALRILSGTKKPRDWMLSRDNEDAINLCSAALYIASGVNEKGREVSKAEVFNAVCVEFERNGSMKLTMEEFVSRAAEMSESDCLGLDELVRECYTVFEELQKKNTMRKETKEEDIDEYLNTEREKEYKTIVWELMNKNYIEEQVRNISADNSKISKERKRRRVGYTDRGTEAAKKKVKEQKWSSRINYDALSELYGEEMQKTTETGISNEHNNEEKISMEAIEEYNEEEEEEGYADDNSAEAQGYDDLEEDYGEREYNEFDEFEF